MSEFRAGEGPVDLSGGPECAGCGAKGGSGAEIAQAGSTEVPVPLGYKCGCLQAFSDAMAEGWTWRGAAAWAKQRREAKP